MVMKTEVKVAIIGGIVALLVALVNHCAPTTSEKPSAVQPQQPPAAVTQPAPSTAGTSGGRVIQMTGEKPTYIEGNQINDSTKGESK